MALVNEMVEEKRKELEPLTDLELLEKAMLELPQVDCPVVHHFGPGIYVREVHLKAGSFAVGHRQRFKHLNVVLTGAVAMVDDNGHLKIIEGPAIFEGEPGRKYGYILKDTIWQNIYATSETNIDVLESTLLDKSQVFNDHENRRVKDAMDSAAVVRADFEAFLIETGIPKALIKSQSENTTDLVAMPKEYQGKTSVRKSSICGEGFFCNYPIEVGEIIAPALLGGKRTPAGRYTNHSPTPNAFFKKFENGDVYLIAGNPINGCSGGSAGEEITVDYRQALAVAALVSEGVL